MSVIKYVSSLLPRIGKPDLMTSLDLVIKELKEQTVPSYQRVDDFMGKWDFKSEWCVNFQKKLTKQSKSKFRGNYISVIRQSNDQLLKNLDTLKYWFDRELEGDVIKSVITYSKVQALHYLDQATFASKYSRMILIHTLDLEIGLKRGDVGVAKSLSNAQLKWLDATQDEFIHALSLLGMDDKSLKKALTEVPDIEVNSETERAVAASVGVGKINPFQVNRFTTTWNIFYQVGIQLANWQHSRYEAAQEERRLVEYQLKDLKEAMDGKADPKLQKAIEYTQDRLAKVNYKIAKYEEG